MDAAGLRHLRKAGFHCFRRKFASELKDVPLKELMALGGWRDPKTVIQCYQQAVLGRMRERWPTAIPSPNPLTPRLGSYAQQAKFYAGGDLPPQDRWPSGRGRAPGERANVTSNDGILSVKSQKMYEFPHNLFFAAVFGITL